MLHSLDPARPFQVANTHSWVVSENNDKAIEDATPFIPDRVIWLQTIFQKKSVAALPVVTYQAGETVIAEGSRTGRLIILTKGAVAIVKEDTEIARVAEPGAVFGELSVLLRKPHTAEVRALETSQFHVANAATLFSQDPIAVRLHAANHALIQLKSQLKDGQPNSVVAKTVSKMEGLLAVSGASLVYAGYPYDPFSSVAH